MKYTIYHFECQGVEKEDSYENFLKAYGFWDKNSSGVFEEFLKLSCE